MEPMLARDRRILLDIDGEIMVIGSIPIPPRTATGLSAEATSRR